ncbi:MAG: hypothetical protein Fur0024_0830 [Patescibacteria group bacterium]
MKRYSEELFKETIEQLKEQIKTIEQLKEQIETLRELLRQNTIKLHLYIAILSFIISLSLPTLLIQYIAEQSTSPGFKIIEIIIVLIIFISSSIVTISSTSSTLTIIINEIFNQKKQEKQE